MEKDCDGDGGKLGGMVAAKNNEMRNNISRSPRNLQLNMAETVTIYN